MVVIIHGVSPRQERPLTYALSELGLCSVETECSVIALQLHPAFSDQLPEAPQGKHLAVEQQQCSVGKVLWGWPLTGEKTGTLLALRASTACQCAKWRQAMNSDHDFDDDPPEPLVQPGEDEPEVQPDDPDIEGLPGETGNPA